ncbi:peptidylprolyl isomerase [Algoriphagus confluentis]|uniref:peptidylprolyl isomerase n=1 Tax=Algoriphagus confluentis TaxID=1697556 RepID=A0ABQ6PI48_9BACT|nr:peptidylprolyl isomerase [Algoriphagus confluentis]
MSSILNFLSGLLILLALEFQWLRINSDPIKVEMKTNYGTMVLLLYDETPIHRDNFIKLVNEGIYDSLLFHRVIEGFMIQTGDTQSKSANSTARLGSSDLPYTLPAEIRPEYFHKKGAIGAARTNNPQRVSSSTQFYIVQGKIQNDSLLRHNQGRINQFLSRHYAVNDPKNKPLLDSLEQARAQRDSLLAVQLQAKWNQIAENYQEFEAYQIPDPHQEIYRKLGGSPHLDQSYTVFGEVISGMEVIDSIASVPTNRQDRPLSEVRILQMKILD